MTNGLASDHLVKRNASLRTTLLWRASSMFVNCLQLLAVGLLLELMLFTDSRVPVLIRLSIIAFLLAGIARSHGWLLLVAIQMSLFFGERSVFSTALSFERVLFCWLSLGLIALAYSKHNTGQLISDWIATRICELVEPMKFVGDSEDEAVSVGQSARHFFLRLLALGAVVFAGAMLMAFLPITPANSRQWLLQSRANDSILWPGPTVLTSIVLLLVLFQHAAWRQLTNAQASLWLRAGFITHHYRDLIMIARRRMKIRRKAMKQSASKVTK